MNLLRSMAEDKYEEFVEIRRELVELRYQMRLIEAKVQHVEEDAANILYDELELLKEKEHYCIRCAKELMSERIWINKTLREHRAEAQATGGTNVPV